MRLDAQVFSDLLAALVVGIEDPRACGAPQPSGNTRVVVPESTDPDYSDPRLHGSESRLST